MTPLPRETIEEILYLAVGRKAYIPENLDCWQLESLCTELLALRRALRRALEVAEEALKFYGNSMSYSLDTYLGISGEMMHRCVLYGDSTEINDVSSHAGRRARESLTEIAKIKGET